MTDLIDLDVANFISRVVIKSYLIHLRQNFTGLMTASGQQDSTFDQTAVGVSITTIAFVIGLNKSHFLLEVSISIVFQSCKNHNKIF